MVGNVQFPGQCDRFVILTTHHVKPLELDTENQWRSLNLVLFGCGHFLMTHLTIVQVLTLTKVLTSEVSSQSCVNVVSMADIQ